MKFLPLTAMFFLAFPALSQESIMNYMATIPAECVSAERNGKNILNECHSNLVNVAYKTGRAMFLFNLGGAVAFSGDSDKQISPDSYELQVSVINVNKQRISATGHCSVVGNPVVSAVYTCSAAGSDGTSYQVSMRSTGRPVINHR